MTFESGWSEPEIEACGAAPAEVDGSACLIEGEVVWSWNLRDNRKVWSEVAACVVGESHRAGAVGVYYV